MKGNTAERYQRHHSMHVLLSELSSAYRGIQQEQPASFMHSEVRLGAGGSVSFSAMTNSSCIFIFTNQRNRVSGLSADSISMSLFPADFHDCVVRERDWRSDRIVFSLEGLNETQSNDSHTFDCSLIEYVISILNS